MKTYSRLQKINNLLSGNDHFRSHADKDLYGKLANGQSPFALVITCSDSRVIPEHIFNVPAGSLFVIRTAGNVVNEGELASIKYGLEHLNIDLVIVLAHTECGAIHAAIKGENSEYLAPIINNITKNILDEKDECKASKINAIKQVEYIKTKFPHFQGEIIPMLYNIKTLNVDIIE